jgi:hypothetical protein
MGKVTKVQIRDFVKTKLSSDPQWSQQALLRIYQFQTEEEQQSRDTLYNNGVGFSGVDGRILTSFAKQLKNKHYLTDKQLTLLMKKMPKYWEQIVRVSDEEKLKSLIS